MSGATQKNKILIIGGSGTLGTSLKDAFEFRNSDFPNSKNLNLLNKKILKSF